MDLNFTLRIDLGNDAMQTPTDVANALRVLADRLDGGVWGDGTSESIRDENGNTVGDWKGASADEN